MPGTALDKPVVLGRVHGLFGVKGWIKVYSHTRPMDAILDYDRWWIGRADSARPFRVLEAREQGKTLVARLADPQGVPLADRDAVMPLLEQDISVARADLPSPEPDEYYWVDLVGLSVYTDEGQPLGRVDAMMETGANDVLVVKGERERLIPWVMDDVVQSVDLTEGRITVDWDPDF